MGCDQRIWRSAIGDVYLGKGGMKSNLEYFIFYLLREQVTFGHAEAALQYARFRQTAKSEITHIPISANSAIEAYVTDLAKRLLEEI